MFDKHAILTAEGMERLAADLLTSTLVLHGPFGTREINLYQWGWKFKWNMKGLNNMGLCEHNGKRISLNSRYALPNEGRPVAHLFENIVRHEIAHALDIEIRGKSDHSNAWRQLALQVGCDGTTRCIDPLARFLLADATYTYRCSSCGGMQHHNKVSKRLISCGMCSDLKVYEEKYRMRLIHEECDIASKIKRVSLI